MKRTGLLPRRTQVRDARLFVVAVEGEVAEPWYFAGLAEHGLFDATRLLLIVLPPVEGRSAPEHVAARLAEFELLNPVIPEDPRWLVVDVDRHHNLQSVLNEAARQGWGFAVSNPCFEVWLYLHLGDNPTATLSADAKSEWGRLRNAAGSGWPFDRSHVRLACERARSRHGDDRWIPDAPGSTVYLLVEALPGLAPLAAGA